MEKDQKISTEEQVSEPEEIGTEEQVSEPEEIGTEEQVNEVEKSASENIDEIKEISPEEKILDLEDKIVRTLAEMENQRRRFEKEREDAFNYGGFAFAKETLNLIDNLERSKQILENDEVLKNSDALKKTLEHFDIINKDMVSILSKNGITPINTIGKKLDPNLHQAMMEIEDDQKEPGSIIQEIQKGFMMKDRLLRPSLVGVSKKTENKEKKSEENKENLDN